MQLRWLFLILATLGAAGHGAAAEPPADVFIPGFFDTQTPLTRPDLAPGTTLHFVTAADYPPFDFTAPDGALTGFNVEVARALCAALKVACTIQARAWADLVPALTAHQADAVIASQKITAAARRAVAFTQPYYRTPARFVARTATAADAVSPAALAGRTVAVEAGSAQEAFLRRYFPAAKVVPFPSAAAARDALKAGRTDLLFDDGIGAALWLGSDAAAGCCAFRGGPYTERRFFGEGAGIAIRPDDPLLRRALDYALERITADGTYADLYLKWFPIGFY